MTLAGSRSVVGSVHIQAFTFFVSRSRSVVRGAHIQAFTFSRGKTLWRSRSVVRGAHIQAFTFLLVKGTLKITVGCPPCTTAPASCRRPRTRTGRRPSRHPEPQHAAMSDQNRALGQEADWPEKKKSKGTFCCKNISGEGIILNYSLKLIQKTRRRGKLQALRQHINSKTIGLSRVKTVIVVWKMVLRTIALFYLPLRNIFPLISSHDPPCQKTKRLFQRGISPNQETCVIKRRLFSSCYNEKSAWSSKMRSMTCAREDDCSK